MFQPQDYFNLEDSVAASLFEGCEYVWEAVRNIGTNVKRLVGNKRIFHGEVMAGAHIGDGPIYIAEGARVEPGAYIEGPSYIGPNVTIRHGAYIRGNVIMLDGSLIGHVTEAKNTILLAGAKAPHFCYLGDSILGHHVNLGAGTKLSNLTVLSVKDPVTGTRPNLSLAIGDESYNLGISKLGAILGDRVQTGCNAVLNPACLVGPDTLIYPNVSLRKGYYPPKRIIKLRQQIVEVERQ